MAEARKAFTETWTFVLPEDRAKPVEQQTVFELSPLSQAERMVAWDRREIIVEVPGGERHIHRRGFQTAREIAIDHIVDIQNFPASAPLPYPKNGDRDARVKYLEQLTDMDLVDIGIEIRDKSVIGKTERD